jgi:fatty-acyl-CoA synthase
MNVGYLLTQKAAQVGNREALVFENKRFTFGELNARVNSLANAMLHLGIKKGDHVGVLLRNCNEFWEAYFAIAKIGAVIVPINWRLVSRELEFVINDSEAKMLMLGEEFEEIISGISTQLANVKDYIIVKRGTGSQDSKLKGSKSYENLVATYPDSEPGVDEVKMGDDLAIIYTSGTTGRPKGAVHTHEATLWNAANQIIHIGLRTDEIVLVWGPLYHVGGLYDFSFPMFYTGGKMAMLREFDPVIMMETIDRERVTILIAVPTILRMMLALPNFKEYDKSSLHILMVAGEPVDIDFIKQVMAHFPHSEIIQGYGLTEGISFSTVLDSKYAIEKIGSIGKPFWGVELRVVDEQGNVVGVGEVGEIVQRGTHTMRGYWKLPKETEDIFKGGWMHTGDLAKVDEDGFIFLVARKKDMIRSGGENIYPAEIEAVLYSSPKIFEAAVIGVPDKKWVEVVKAYVVLKPEQTMTEEEVIELCKKNLASYKKPQYVEFVDALPKTAVGKIAKGELRKRSGANA